MLGLVSAADASENIVPYEQVQPVPKQVIPQIGSESGGDRSYYYVELNGSSAIAAMASVQLHLPYAGFSGAAVQGPKASFDPTSGRHWAVKHATYSLRRGNTGEALDIQAFQLDGLDSEGADGYWNGCTKVDNQPGTCWVAPWNQVFIRQIR